MSMRALPPYLYAGEPVPFGQKFTYVSDHDIHAMMDPAYFMPVRRRLCVGDCIFIVQVERPDPKDPENRVMAFTEIMLTSISEDAITIAELRNVVKMPYFRTGKQAPAVAPREPEVYVPENGTVVKGKSGYDVKVGGKTVASGLTDAMAGAVASGAEPIPN